MLAARFARQATVAGRRTYAVAAAGSKSGVVTPPVALYGVDGTYANALYIAAAKSNSLDATDKALQSLKGVLSKDKKLAGVLATPTLNPAEKGVVVSEIAKAAGQNATIKNLLQALADNNRLGLTADVITKFETLMGAHRGEIEATITSATQLDPKTIQRLQAALSKSQFTGPGKQLKVVNKVNPDILGGLVVEVADRTIDLSISSKMTKLNKLLTDSL